MVIWQGIVIDGHNRLEICTKHGIGFTTVEKEFADREAVMDWMDSNQLGRRNLNPDQFRLLLGRRYNRQKKSKVDTLRQNAPIDQIDPSGATAAILGKEHGVSEATVKRAAKFAEEVENTPELQEAISTGKPVLQVKREIKEQKREEKAGRKPILSDKLTDKQDSKPAIKTDTRAALPKISCVAA